MSKGWKQGKSPEEIAEIEEREKLLLEAMAKREQGLWGMQDVTVEDGVGQEDGGRVFKPREDGRA